MPSSPAQPDDAALAELVQTLEPRGRLVRRWSLAGGISTAMFGLEIEGPAGSRRVVLRRPSAWALERSPRAAAHEFRLLERVRAAGLPAPRPLWTGDLGDESALVLEYVEGAPDLAPADPAGALRQAAELLARVHRVDATDSELSFLFPQTPRPPQGFVRAHGLDAALGEGRIRATLEAAWPWPCAATPVLLHGDYWPGNLLWRRGRLVAVIDWEDAEAGDPLADLAIARLDLWWTFGPEAVGAFTAHYRACSGRDLDPLPHWDLWAALRPASRLAEWAAGFPALGRPDITEATMRAGHRAFVAQATARLDRAGR